MEYLKENKNLFIISALTFLVIYISSFIPGYGYFIDEFYYIACAKRLAFGYVDHPPFAPFILKLTGIFFGYSLAVIRFLPAAATAASVFLTGILIKNIGGNKYAQLIGSAGIAAMPVTIAFGGFFSMNAFEPLFTILSGILLVQLRKTNNLKLWVWIGVIWGLGIMNKHTFVLIAAFFFISLLVIDRKIIFNKYFLYGMAIGFIVVLPNIIWQYVNGFPSLEFYRNITEGKNVYTPPVAFIMGQITMMSPTTFPLWFGGLIALLFNKKLKEHRWFGIFFSLSFIFMLLTGTSRFDRLAFAYPFAFAGGALFFSILLKDKIIFKTGFMVITISGVLLALPLFLPYFSYETTRSYVDKLGINTEIEKGKKPPISQILADRIGWEEKVDLVGNAYNKLTDEEKKRVVVAGQNYGQAGAIDLYGIKYNLPPAVTGHNNYYLWSKEHINGNILLQLSAEDNWESYKEAFDSVEVVPGRFHHEFVSNHENDLVVLICRYPKVKFSELLEDAKNFH